MPHFDSHLVVQHVSFHLADSLPMELLERLKRELKAVPLERQGAERRIRIEDWMDAGYGCCLLRESAAARLVQDALLRFDAQRYRLLAWVVMPNHVHALFQTMEGWTMASIVASWKSYTGRRLMPLMDESSAARRPRRVWHREYWDRYVRDDEHFQAVKEYVRRNPVRAGLVERPEDWEWSSSRLEHGARVG